MKTAILSVCLLAACAGSVQAFDGCYGGYGYGCGYGYLYDNLRDEVPYFAAYPPVYYSYPVPRTYGYSPFAYPPGVMTPEVIETVEPAIIENPHVESSAPKPKAEPAEKKETTVAKPQGSEPLVILNPFVAEPVAAR